MIFLNDRPWGWVLISLIIQLIYVNYLFYCIKFETRENWAIIFQECFYIYFLFLTLDFTLDESQEVSDTYLFMYFIGNSSSIFFLFFEILDKKFDFYRKITIRKKKNGKIIERFIAEPKLKKEHEVEQLKRNMTIFEDMIKTKIRRTIIKRKSIVVKSKSLKRFSVKLVDYKKKSVFFKLQRKSERPNL